jgi:N6-L-threonylcarbamoyladenine synthase
VGLGYPGGPEIEKEAAAGEVGKIKLPRPMKGSDEGDFSFSGLKNAARLLLDREPGIGQPGTLRADFCAEVQAAIAECLADRCRLALRRTGRKLLTVSGGVSANRVVARALEEAARAEGARLLTPAPGWNTDNAAMIAAVTARRHLDGAKSDWETDADPRWSVESGQNGA